VVEAMLGEEGRLRALYCGYGGWYWGSLEDWGMWREVRELLKEERRLVRLSSLRMPEGLRFGRSGEGTVRLVFAVGIGDRGVRKLSCRPLLVAVEVDVLALLSRSGSGVGGKAPGM